MKKLVFSLILVLMIFISPNVWALEACTTSEMNRLKELASNVKFNTSTFVMGEDENGEEVEFVYDIEVLNYDKSLRITYKSNEILEETLVDSDNTKLEGFTPGDKITFYIYAYTSNLCVSELLRTVTVDLPIPNAYYYFHKEKCQEHSDFKYCQEYLSNSKTFAEIDKLFDEYLKDEDKIIKIDKNNAIWYIIGGSVVGISMIALILVINFRKRKEKDDI